MTREWDGVDRRKPENRDFDQSVLKVILHHIEKDAKQWRPFGFKIHELIAFAVFAFGIAAFFIRSEDAMKRLITVSEYTVRFMKNSDSYHSAVIGTTFEQGKPINDGYDIQRIRRVLEGERKP